MGWDDSEDEVETPAIAKPSVGKWDDSDSEEEPSKPVVKQPEPVVKKSEPVVKKPEPVVKPAAKAAKKKKKNVDDIPLDDPVAEKLRLKRLQEKSDAQNIGDTFAGFIQNEEKSDEEEEEDDDDDEDDGPKTKTINSFDDLKIERHGDLDMLRSLIEKKMVMASEHEVKNPRLFFFKEIESALLKNNDLKDLEQFLVRLKHVSAERKKGVAAKKQAEREKKLAEEAEKKKKEAEEKELREEEKRKREAVKEADPFDGFGNSGGAQFDDDDDFM